MRSLVGALDGCFEKDGVNLSKLTRTHHTQVLSHPGIDPMEIFVHLTKISTYMDTLCKNTGSDRESAMYVIWNTVWVFIVVRQGY